jgi:hypothetical protein
VTGQISYTRTQNSRWNYCPGIFLFKIFLMSSWLFLICWCRSQIFQLCHIFKGSITYLYVMVVLHSGFETQIPFKSNILRETVSSRSKWVYVQCTVSGTVL